MHTLCALVARSYVCIAPRNLHLAPSPPSSSSSSSSTNFARVAATLAGGRWNSRDVQSFGDERASCTSHPNVRQPVMDSPSYLFPPERSPGTIVRRCAASSLESGTRDRDCTRSATKSPMMTTATSATTIIQPA